MRALITSMGGSSPRRLHHLRRAGVVENRPGHSFRLDIQVAWFSIESTTPINAAKQSFPETFLRSGPAAFLQFLLPNGPHSDLTFILRHLSNWFRVVLSIVLHGCKTTGYL